MEAEKIFVLLMNLVLKYALEKLENHSHLKSDASIFVCVTFTTKSQWVKIVGQFDDTIS